MQDIRIQELLDMAAQEGFTLAMDPADICQLEDAGYVVDLVSGEIVGTNADWFSLVAVAPEGQVQP